MNSIYDEVLAAIHSVWHRRWLALGVAWAVCLVGWLVVAMIPNSYESRARIFVQLDDPLAKQIGMDPGDQKREIERIRVGSYRAAKEVSGYENPATPAEARGPTRRGRRTGYPTYR